MSPSTIVGTVSGGKVVVEVPPDWPEGAEVRVDRLDPEDELPDDEDGCPEAIASGSPSWTGGSGPGRG